MEKMSKFQLLAEYFEITDKSKLLSELTKLSTDERTELATLAAVELGVELSA